VAYEARDVLLDRTVVLKALHPTLFSDERFASINLFRVKRARTFPISHLAAILDSHLEVGDTTPFVVSDFVEGQTLADLMVRRRESGEGFAPAEIALIAEEVASALATLHPTGPHANLTPRNIWLTSQGIRLSDAYRLEGRTILAWAKELPQRDHYLAPEQYRRGGEETPQADIFALGLVVGELLAGAPVRMSRSLRESVPGVTDAIDALFLSATAESPMERHPTVGAFLAALHRALPDEAWAAHADRDDTEIVDVDEAFTAEERALLALHSPFRVPEPPAEPLPETVSSDPPAESPPTESPSAEAPPGESTRVLVAPRDPALPPPLPKAAAPAGAPPPVPRDARGEAAIPAPRPTPELPGAPASGLAVPEVIAVPDELDDLLDTTLVLPRLDGEGDGTPDPFTLDPGLRTTLQLPALHADASEEPAGNPTLEARAEAPPAPRPETPTSDDLEAVKRQAQELAAQRRKEQALADLGPQASMFHEEHPTLDVPAPPSINAAVSQNVAPQRPPAPAAPAPSPAPASAAAPPTAAAPAPAGQPTWVWALMGFFCVSAVAAAWYFATQRGNGDTGRKSVAPPAGLVSVGGNIAPVTVPDSQRTTPPPPPKVSRRPQDLATTAERAPVGEPPAPVADTPAVPPPPPRGGTAEHSEQLRRAVVATIEKRAAPSPAPSSPPPAVPAAKAVAAPTPPAPAAKVDKTPETAPQQTPEPQKAARAAAAPPPATSRESAGSPPAPPPAAVVAMASPKRGAQPAAAAAAVATGEGNTEEFECPAGMRLVVRKNTREVAGQRVMSREPYCIDYYEFPGKGQVPRTQVTWAQARGSCEERGKRLCTSAEWRYACGGTYPYGKDYDPSACNTMGPQGEERPLRTAGSMATCRSGTGLYDMSGNVSEWTADQTVNGGNSHETGEEATCGHSPKRLASSAGAYIGFRCCADPE
jgi:serine/threonine protein kinase